MTTKLILPHYDVHEGNGPFLLMLHGLLSSRAQWLPNLEALKAVSSPVVVELFGHGRSVAPEDSACYHPDYYIEGFEEIRRRLGASEWNVMGFSLGAGLTLRYCLNKPESVTSQIFTNSTSAFAESETTQKYRDRGDALIARFKLEGMRAVEAIAVHPKNAGQIPEPIKSALLEDCELLKPAGVARTITFTNGNSSVRSLVHKNTVPALLICGENEKRFSAFRDFAVEKMPLLDVVGVSAGHAVNIEASDEFNRVVTAFLK